MIRATDSTPASAFSLERASGIGLAAVLGAYLLITSTVTLSERYWLFDVKRYLEVWLLVLLALVVFLAPGLREAFARQVGRIPRWMGLLLLAILTLGVLSAAVNRVSRMSLAYSLADVALMALVALGTLCVAACREIGGPAFDRVALILLAIVGTAVGVQELLGVLAAWNSGLEFHPRVALLHFSWPRFYNQVQGWCMPLIAALPFVIRGKFSVKLLCIVALALNWYVLIATGGRATTLGVLFALAFAAALFPLARRTLLGYSVLGLLAGVVIYALVVLGHQQLVGEAEPAATTAAAAAESAPAPAGMERRFTDSVTGERMLTSSGRIHMWRSSWPDARSHPLLGIGPMNYACKGPIYREGHPHSFPVQTLVEWGMPVFAMVFVITLSLFWHIVAGIRRQGATVAEEPVLRAALATALIASAVVATLDGVLVMPASQVTGVLVCGWLLGCWPQRSTPVGNRGLGQALLLFTLCLALALAFFSTRELRLSEARLEQTPIMDRLIPRYWQNGKVCALFQKAE